MKLLRHPKRAIREPFGKAGLIVAIVALVAATVGGAYAATGGQPLATSSGKHHKKNKNKKSNAGLNGKQKKQVKNIAKSEAKKYANSNPGAAGATGPQGPAGAAGAKGDKGEKGDNGTNGTNGANGTNGVNGESVEAFPTAGEPGEPCEGTGGVVYEVEATPTEICNGKDGKEGSPWTAGGLPAGATEKGVWSFSANTEDGELNVPISFNVPLSGVLVASKVHFVGPTGGGVCEGNVNGPTAPEGELCVYEAATANVSGGEIYALNESTGASSAGALIYFEITGNGAYGYGSWAVTGG